MADIKSYQPQGLPQLSDPSGPNKYLQGQLQSISKTVNQLITSRVTSVAMTVPAGLAVAGSPITGSGTFALSWLGTIPAANIPALSALSGSVTSAQLPTPTTTSLGGVQAVAAVAHNWIASISTAGVPALSQPAFSDISGALLASQISDFPNDVTKVLLGDGSWGVPSGGGSTPNVQRFTASGTYTPTPGTSWIRVRMVGGGGGACSLGTGTRTNGATGGTTSFAGWTAIGGGGATGSSGIGGLGGTGGVNGTGSLLLRIAGNAGGNAVLPVSAPGPWGGAPSINVFVTGGAGVSASANSGAGGGAAFASGQTPGSAGASGEYVEFIIHSPVSGSVTIGAGGAGGGSGTSAGGTGGSGVVIIEEHP